MSNLELTSPLTSLGAAKRHASERPGLRQGLMAAGVCVLMLVAAAGIRLLAAASALSLW
ncbi:hypothetical protein [Rhizobium sp. LC145]|uniref:hypothetical protein n=1 Tax=Rhizobium sp. LC145 TaxID=1120688 RepID=UPI000B1597C7|nr:hypothetical protein [Rhizobium sp. LC145]